jgi:pyruvate dehydrogenase E2 component (dihydrolipoamide acetyltransferase)
METGHLIKWLKQPGDAVKKGEALAELETDKAVMEIEAFADGYLAGPLSAADSDLPIGTVIGYLVDVPATAETVPATIESPDTEASDKKAPDKIELQNQIPSAEIADTTRENTTEVTQSPAVAIPEQHLNSPVDNNKVGSNIPVSPYARGLAREMGLNLAQIDAGPDGVIRASQVIATALAGPREKLEDGPEYKLQPLTPMQRAIANNMTAAAITPTFRISAKLSLEPLGALAQREKYSLTLLLARACALTVAAHPRFNAIYTPRGLAQRQQVDVGIAVDVPRGLLTPVLRDAAQRPFQALAKDWLTLKNKAMGKTHSHRLTPEDYRGATFYLSNLGMYKQVSHFDAVVPLGAAAILSLSAEQQDGKAEFTLSCDHRVIYGAYAARFIETLAHFLSSPELITTETVDRA